MAAVILVNKTIYLSIYLGFLDGGTHRSTMSPKLDLILQQCDFVDLNLKLGKWLLTAPTTYAQFHPTTYPALKFPKYISRLFPLCHKTLAKQQKSNGLDDAMQVALQLDPICVCKKKAIESDRLIECHNAPV